MYKTTQNTFYLAIFYIILYSKFIKEKENGFSFSKLNFFFRGQNAIRIF